MMARNNGFKERSKASRVNFFGNPADLFCFALAASGISTEGIQQALAAAGFKLTEGQISYRLMLAERKRKANTKTQRALFRSGKSPIASALVAQVMANKGIGREVKQVATGVLDSRGQFQPRPTGVMTNSNGVGH